MWPRIINIITGLWLMVAPAIFQFDRKVANNDHIVGPLIISVAVISICDVVRNFRYVNTAAGLWLVLAPWIIAYDDNTAAVNSVICGLLTIGLSLIKGKLDNQFGGGWRSLFDENPVHLQEANKQTQERY